MSLGDLVTVKAPSSVFTQTRMAATSLGHIILWDHGSVCVPHWMKDRYVVGGRIFFTYLLCIHLFVPSFGGVDVG